MPVALLARVVDTQANQSFEATFERFPVRIGRNQLNDLHIDRPYVSQFHGAIEVRGGRQILVKDLGSTNGTVFAGQRLARDAPVDVTHAPEIHVGPIVVQFKVVESAQKEQARREGLLDAEPTLARPSAPRPVAPGVEDPFVRQLVPYIEAYRNAWTSVYRVVYEHLQRLPPDARAPYVRRLSQEYPAVGLEADFQKIAKYYGVEPRSVSEMGPAQAAHAALTELARTLAPGVKGLEEGPALVGFARKLRDAMEVFLKCFVSLRDGYREFEAEVLARDRTSQGEHVATAKDARELGLALFDPNASPEAPQELQNIFVDVMSHQVALLNGVMEGVKTLLVKLSPKTIEDELERRGKKGGIFSNKYEALWKLYEVRHGDYSGEDKETFLIIFGPQFSRAYAATAGEDYTVSADAGGKVRSRFTLSANQMKR